MVLSDDDVDFVGKLKEIISSANLENDYSRFHFRTTSKDHHRVKRLFEGLNVETKVLVEVANLAELDVFLVQKRNGCACCLSKLSVQEAIDSILQNAEIDFQSAPKGDKQQSSLFRALHKVDSMKECRLKIHSFIKVLFWLEIEIVLQFNANRAAREAKHLQDMTFISCPKNF